VGAGLLGFARRMTRAEDYRQRADEAERRAKQVRDPEAKRAFDEIARQWRVMAEQVERHRW
jgi:hypothetical protein